MPNAEHGVVDATDPPAEPRRIFQALLRAKTVKAQRNASHGPGHAHVQHVPAVATTLGIR
ncbi:hypothetical protein ACFWWB_23695 [Streptomyces sp. NPDC058690]|uniref:hypothetical protein n=1 Tax=Streptomyces sp. NPDC058690 TaxID=3346600 RepID=UPI003665EFC1